MNQVENLKFQVLALWNSLIPSDEGLKHEM